MAAPVAGSPSSPAGKRRKLRHTAVLSDSVKCEYNGGTMETIGERELWLVAVPWELSVDKLHGKTIDLTSSSDFEAISQFSFVPQSCQQCECIPFLPAGRKPGKVKLGPPLKGILSVQKAVNVPEIHLCPPQSSSVDIPSGLKQRWKPFGWRGDPASSSNDVGSISPSPREAVNKFAVDIDELRKKKKKSKKLKKKSS